MNRPLWFDIVYLFWLPSLCAGATLIIALVNRAPNWLAFLLYFAVFVIVLFAPLLRIQLLANKGTATKDEPTGETGELKTPSD